MAGTVDQCAVVNILLSAQPAFVEHDGFDGAFFGKIRGVEIGADTAQLLGPAVNFVFVDIGSHLCVGSLVVEVKPIFRHEHSEGGSEHPRGGSLLVGRLFNEEQNLRFFGSLVGKGLGKVQKGAGNASPILPICLRNGSYVRAAGISRVLNADSHSAQRIGVGREIRTC